MKLHIINLKRREDRWERCQSLPFELERFEAVDGLDHPLLSNKQNNAALHCASSHLLLLQQLFKREETFFLVGEDDLEVIDIGKIQACTQEFAVSNYDVCNMGFNPSWMPVFGEQTETLEGVIAGPTLTTHLYAIKKDAIPKLIKAIKFCIESMMKGASLFSHACDHAWSFDPTIRRCVPKNIRSESDAICRQYASKSDIAI
jgi:hypothetical protein